MRFLSYTAADTTLRFATDTMTLSFRLERSATQVAGVTITTTEVPRQLKDFEARRKQGLGRYLTESELMRDADREFSTLATMRFPGLSLQTDADGRRMWRACAGTVVRTPDA